jgi:hypothetical protein
MMCPIRIASLRKITASAVSGIVFFTAATDVLAQANMWEERRLARFQARSPAEGPLASLLTLPAVKAPSLFPASTGGGPSLSFSRQDPLLQPLIHSSLVRALPLSYATVRDVYLPSVDFNLLVIHLQDVHGHPEAQRNIANSIASIQNELAEMSGRPGNRLLVGVEGAAGPLLTSAYRKYPDGKILAEWAQSFFEKGLLTGAEYAALTSPTEPRLQGLENREAYLRHVRAMRESVSREKAMAESLDLWDRRLGELKSKVYSPAMKAWDAQFAAYGAGRSSLGAYVKLMRGAVRAGRHDNVARFLRALDEESRLDFKRAEAERRALIRGLSARLSPAAMTELVDLSVAFRFGRVGYGEFNQGLLRRMQKAGMELNRYPAFSAYVRYVKSVETIDRRALLEEIETLEKDYTDRSLVEVSANARRVFSMARDLHVARKMVKHELSREDWDNFQPRARDIESLPLRVQKMELSGDDAGGFSRDLQVFEEFYRAGVERDKALAGNLLTAVAGLPAPPARGEPRVAVLVAGGFHSDGLSRIFKEKGIAYVTLAPRFEQISDKDYLDVFRQDKTPLEKLFAGEKLTLIDELGMAGQGERSEYVGAVGPALLALSAWAFYSRVRDWLAQMEAATGSRYRFKERVRAGVRGLAFSVTTAAGKVRRFFVSRGDGRRGHDFTIGETVFSVQGLPSSLLTRLRERLGGVLRGVLAAPLWVGRRWKSVSLGVLGPVGFAFAGDGGTTMVGLATAVLNPVFVAGLLLMAYLYYRNQRSLALATVGARSPPVVFPAVSGIGERVGAWYRALPASAQSLIRDLLPMALAAVILGFLFFIGGPLVEPVLATWSQAVAVPGAGILDRGLGAVAWLAGNFSTVVLTMSGLAVFIVWGTLFAAASGMDARIKENRYWSRTVELSHRAAKRFPTLAWWVHLVPHGLATLRGFALRVPERLLHVAFADTTAAKGYEDLTRPNDTMTVHAWAAFAFWLEGNVPTRLLRRMTLMIAFPFFAAVGLLGSRLTLMVLSLAVQHVLTGGLLLLPMEAETVLSITTWNAGDLFVDGWALEAAGNPGPSGILAAFITSYMNPFGLISLYFLGLLRALISGASHVNRATLAHQGLLNARQSGQIRWWLGWLNPWYLWISLTRPVHLSPLLQDEQGNPVKMSIWRAAFRSSFVGVNSMVAVGPEIAFFVSLGHVLEGPFLPLILLIEGHEKSIMSSGGEFMSSLGINTDVPIPNSSLTLGEVRSLAERADRAVGPGAAEFSRLVAEARAKNWALGNEERSRLLEIASTVDVKDAGPRTTPLLAFLERTLSPIGPAAAEPRLVELPLEDRTPAVKPPLVTGPPPPPPSETLPPGKYVVNTVTDPLRVRQGPGTDTDKVGSLPRGARVEVNNIQGEWGAVEGRWGKGWVFLGHLKEYVETTAPPAESFVTGRDIGARVKSRVTLREPVDGLVNQSPSVRVKEAYNRAARREVAAANPFLNAPEGGVGFIHGGTFPQSGQSGPVAIGELRLGSDQFVREREAEDRSAVGEAGLETYRIVQTQKGWEALLKVQTAREDLAGKEAALAFLRDAASDSRQNETSRATFDSQVRFLKTDIINARQAVRAAENEAKEPLGLRASDSLPEVDGESARFADLYHARLREMEAEMRRLEDVLGFEKDEVDWFFANVLSAGINVQGILSPGQSPGLFVANAEVKLKFLTVAKARAEDPEFVPAMSRYFQLRAQHRQIENVTGPQAALFAARQYRLGADMEARARESIKLAEDFLDAQDHSYRTNAQNPDDARELVNAVKALTDARRQLALAGSLKSRALFQHRLAGGSGTPPHPDPAGPGGPPDLRTLSHLDLVPWVRAAVQSRLGVTPEFLREQVEKNGPGFLNSFPIEVRLAVGLAAGANSLAWGPSATIEGRADIEADDKDRIRDVEVQKAGIDIQAASNVYVQQAGAAYAGLARALEARDSIEKSYANARSLTPTDPRHERYHADRAGLAGWEVRRLAAQNDVETAWHVFQGTLGLSPEKAEALALPAPGVARDTAAVVNRLKPLYQPGSNPARSAVLGVEISRLRHELNLDTTEDWVPPVGFSVVAYPPFIVPILPIPPAVSEGLIGTGVSVVFWPARALLNEIFPELGVNTDVAVNSLAERNRLNQLKSAADVKNREELEKYESQLKDTQDQQALRTYADADGTVRALEEGLRLLARQESAAGADVAAGRLSPREWVSFQSGVNELKTSLSEWNESLANASSLLDERGLTPPPPARDVSGQMPPAPSLDDINDVATPGLLRARAESRVRYLDAMLKFLGKTYSATYPRWDEPHPTSTIASPIQINATVQNGAIVFTTSGGETTTTGGRPSLGNFTYQLTLPLLSALGINPGHEAALRARTELAVAQGAEIDQAREDYLKAYSRYQQTALLNEVAFEAKLTGRDADDVVRAMVDAVYQDASGDALRSSLDSARADADFKAAREEMIAATRKVEDLILRSLGPRHADTLGDGLAVWTRLPALLPDKLDNDNRIKEFNASQDRVRAEGRVRKIADFEPTLQSRIAFDDGGGNFTASVAVMVRLLHGIGVQGLLDDADQARLEALDLQKEDRRRQLGLYMQSLSHQVETAAQLVQPAADNLRAAKDTLRQTWDHFIQRRDVHFEHTRRLAGFEPYEAVRRAMADHQQAARNYVKARQDLQSGLLLLDEIFTRLGIDAGKINIPTTKRGAETPVPPASKGKPFPPRPDAIQDETPFLPSIYDRPGYHFLPAYDKSLSRNHPLADKPVGYDEFNATGRSTGRVIRVTYDLDDETASFVDNRPLGENQWSLGAKDPRREFPPEVLIYSFRTLRSNPYHPHLLPDATLAVDPETGEWAVQSVVTDRDYDVPVEDPARGINAVLDRDGPGTRLTGAIGDGADITHVTAHDRTDKPVDKSIYRDGRLTWRGVFERDGKLRSFEDPRNKIRDGQVTKEERLPPGALVRLPGDREARLPYGGMVLYTRAVNPEGKSVYGIAVQDDNYSTLGGAGYASLLRRDPDHPFSDPREATITGYTAYGYGDAQTLSAGAPELKKEGSIHTLGIAAPFARLGYEGENVYELPIKTEDPGLAYVSPRGESLARETRENVKINERSRVMDTGTLEYRFGYEAPYKNGLVPLEVYSPKGSPNPAQDSFPKTPAVHPGPPQTYAPEPSVLHLHVSQVDNGPPSVGISWGEAIGNFFINTLGAAENGRPGSFQGDYTVKSDGIYDPQGNKAQFNGVNWRGIEYGWNFGDSQHGLASEADWVDRQMADMRAAGVTQIRMPLMDDARHDWRNYGAFRDDLRAFLDAAEKNNMQVELVLFDFLAVGRGNFDMSRAATDEFKDKFLKPFLAEFGAHPALLALDLMNEPEWILDRSVPGGWGDKMEGGRSPVKAADYRYFVEQMSDTVREEAGNVLLVTLGTSVKHHPIATDDAIASHLDYYSWHYYPWMGDLNLWLGSIPANKPFELGEYPTSGKDGSLSPATYMGTVKNHGGVGAAAWNWGAKNAGGPGIDEWSTSDQNGLERSLQESGRVIRGEAGALGSKPGQPAVLPTQDETSSGEAAPVRPDRFTHRAYRGPDGTVYTPQFDGTIVRSLGDPLNPAFEGEKSVLSVPEEFDFAQPDALKILNDPRRVLSTTRVDPRGENGLREVRVYKGTGRDAAGREDESSRVETLYQDKDLNSYRREPDGTWTVTQRGNRAPSYVVNPGDGFAAQDPAALRNLNDTKVGTFAYKPVQSVERPGRFPLDLPLGTYSQKLIPATPKEESPESQGVTSWADRLIYDEDTLKTAVSAADGLLKALDSDLDLAAARRIHWDPRPALMETLAYQQRYLGFFYDTDSPELKVAEGVVGWLKEAYGPLLEDRLASAYAEYLDQARITGESARRFVERQVAEILMMQSLSLVPDLLARSQGMAHKPNLVHAGEISRHSSEYFLQWLKVPDKSGSWAADLAPLFDAAEGVIAAQTGRPVDHASPDEAGLVISLIHTLVWVGHDPRGEAALRPSPLTLDQAIQVTRIATEIARTVRESYQAHQKDHAGLPMEYNSRAVGQIVYWAEKEAGKELDFQDPLESAAYERYGAPRWMVELREEINKNLSPSFAEVVRMITRPREGKDDATSLFWEHYPDATFAEFTDKALALANRFIILPEVMMNGLPDKILDQVASDADVSPDAIRGIHRELVANRQEKTLVMAWNIYEALAFLVLPALGWTAYLGWRGRRRPRAPSPSVRTPSSSSGGGGASTASVFGPEEPSDPETESALRAVGAVLGGDNFGGGLGKAIQNAQETLESPKVFKRLGIANKERVTFAYWRKGNMVWTALGVIFLAMQLSLDYNTALIWVMGVVFLVQGILGPVGRVGGGRENWIGLRVLLPRLFSSDLSRRDRQNKAVDRLLGDIRQARESLDLLWVEFHPRLRLRAAWEPAYSRIYEEVTGESYDAIPANERPATWSAAWVSGGKHRVGIQKGLREWVVTQRVPPAVEKTYQDAFNETTTFWVNPPQDEPGHYAYAENMRVNLDGWLRYTEDFLKYVHGHPEYELFSSTHYQYYDVQGHIPVLYVRGPRFEMLSRDGQYFLMPGRAADYTGYRPVDPQDDRDRLHFNGPAVYERGLFGNPVHPAPVFNIPYYAQTAADRARTSAEFMAGNVFPTNVHRQKDGLSAGMSFGEALNEENTDRHIMKTLAARADKGHLGAGPVNTSRENTLETHEWTILLLLVGGLLLAWALFPYRGALLDPGIVLNLGNLLTWIQGITGVELTVAVEDVDYLRPGMGGFSLFVAISMAMGAFSMLTVGMALKLVLFAQGFKRGHRAVGFGVSAAVTGFASWLLLAYPLTGWTLVPAVVLWGFGILVFFQALLATRYKEELTVRHLARFVPEWYLWLALQDITDLELSSVGVSRDRWWKWMKLGPVYALERLSGVEDGMWIRVYRLLMFVLTLGRYPLGEDSFWTALKGALMGIPIAQRPVQRLLQDKNLNLAKVVFLANMQGEGRHRLIQTVLRHFETAPDDSLRGYLDALRAESEELSRRLGALGTNPEPHLVQEVYSTYYLEKGQFDNLDILSRLLSEDIQALISQEDLWPEIVLMQTTFGETAEERLFPLLESACRQWPNIRVVVTFDDNDEKGRNSVLEKMAPGGHLEPYAHQIVISNHSHDGTNYNDQAIQQRHKPQLNGEAVFRLAYRYRKHLDGKLPAYMVLVDMEDKIGQEMIDAKMAIWAMRERVINQQLARAESTPPDRAGPLARWIGGALILGGVLVMILDLSGVAFASLGIVAAVAGHAWSLAGAAVIAAGLVLRRVAAPGSADKEARRHDTEDRDQWGIRLDVKALGWEYRRAVRKLAKGAGANGKELLKPGADLSRLDPGGQFDAIADLLTAERDHREGGRIDEADGIRREFFNRFGAMDSAARVRYQLWAFMRVFPNERSFRRQIFAVRNTPDVIQAELRQVPVERADRQSSSLSHLDYLIWHNTIQIGQAASGFMFLGGTGNTFNWAMLGGNDAHPSTRLFSLLRPLREQLHREEEEQPLWRKLVALVLPWLPESWLKIWLPSRMFHTVLNVYQPTGVWDRYNIIEDSERGRRSAFLGWMSQRLVGKFTSVLEDTLPRLGPKWLNQRQRWIIQQTFSAILRYLPLAWLFFGQYLGAGLGFALLGDRAHVFQGVIGMTVGFVGGGIAAYVLGTVVFFWFSRAGLIRNLQFHVNPIQNLGGARGPWWSWRAIRNRVVGYYKFQQISHLAATTPIMMASSLFFYLTIFYAFGLVLDASWIQTGLDLWGNQGVIAFVGSIKNFIQSVIPVVIGIIPSTFWGIFIFLYPPVLMRFMAVLTVFYVSWRDDESLREAIRQWFTGRPNSYLLVFMTTGFPGSQGADDVHRTNKEVEKALIKAKEAEEKARKKDPRRISIDRAILEGFRDNLELVNEIADRIHQIHRTFGHDDDYLNAQLTDQATTDILALVDDQVTRLVRELKLTSAKKNRIIRLIRRDVQSLRDTTQGRMRFFSGGFVAAGAIFVGLGMAGVTLNLIVPLWVAAVLVGVGFVFLTLALLDLVLHPFNVGIRLSPQIKHFFHQLWNALFMDVYFSFLNPAAWRDAATALSSYHRPGANESHWTRGRDEGMGDLNLWEITWWDRLKESSGRLGAILMVYTLLPLLALGVFPVMDDVRDWRENLPRQFAVEPYKEVLVLKPAPITDAEIARWRGMLRAEYQRVPVAFQGWIIKGLVNEAARLYQLGERDPDSLKRAPRYLQLALQAVEIYREGQLRLLGEQPEFVHKRIHRDYQAVVLSVEGLFHQIGKPVEFEKIFHISPTKLSGTWIPRIGPNDRMIKDPLAQTVRMQIKTPPPGPSVASGEQYTLQFKLNQTLDLENQVVVIPWKYVGARDGVKIRTATVSRPEAPGDRHRDMGDTVAPSPGRWSITYNSPESVTGRGEFDVNTVNAVEFQLINTAARVPDSTIIVGAPTVHPRPNLRQPLSGEFVSRPIEATIRYKSPGFQWVVSVMMGVIAAVMGFGFDHADALLSLTGLALTGVPGLLGFSMVLWGVRESVSVRRRKAAHISSAGRDARTLQAAVNRVLTADPALHARWDRSGFTLRLAEEGELSPFESGRAKGKEAVIHTAYAGDLRTVAHEMAHLAYDPAQAPPTWFGRALAWLVGESRARWMEFKVSRAPGKPRKQAESSPGGGSTTNAPGDMLTLLLLPIRPLTAQLDPGFQRRALAVSEGIEGRSPHLVLSTLGQDYYSAVESGNLERPKDLLRTYIAVLESVSSGIDARTLERAFQVGYRIAEIKSKGLEQTLPFIGAAPGRDVFKRVYAVEISPSDLAALGQNKPVPVLEAFAAQAEVVRLSGAGEHISFAFVSRDGELTSGEQETIRAYFNEGRFHFLRGVVNKTEFYGKTYLKDAGVMSFQFLRLGYVINGEKLKGALSQERLTVITATPRHWTDDSAVLPVYKALQDLYDELNELALNASQA